MPIMLLLLLGYGVDLDVKHVPIYVFDRDGSQDSQASSSVSRHAIFRVRASSTTTEIHARDRRWPLQARVRRSVRFRAAAARRRPVAVQALSTPPTTTPPTSRSAMRSGGRWILAGCAARLDASQGFPTAGDRSIEFRTWYNEELESRDFIIPGVVALVMTLVGAFLSSLTIAREWERGTMEQLVSTPVTAREIMVGKLMPYFLIGLVRCGSGVVVASAGSRSPSAARWRRSSSQLGALPDRPARDRLHDLRGDAATRGEPDRAPRHLAAHVPAFGLPFSIDQMPAPYPRVTHVVRDATT